MPLQGESKAARTYVNLERIHDGSELLHRCQHAVLGVNCVQKTVPIGAGSVAFFEPRLLEDLDHPHITPVREAQFDPDYPQRVTLVMPWYSGGSIARALVADHRFSLVETIVLARHVLDALEYVHTRKRYVHRDIKGDNVLLDDSKRIAFLSDFGLAAALDDLDRAPAVAATYEYMAPECAITGFHTPASDMYGVGMLLFEILNGRIPWETIDRARVERRVVNGHRALPDSHYAPGVFAAHVPEQLRQVTRKAIRNDPGRRYQSAAEFIQALNQVATIDWRQLSGAAAEGVWEGTWPPHLRLDQQDTYRVTSRPLRGGPSKGKLRVVAHYQRAGKGGWRRIGVADRDIVVEDAEALRRFFSEVAVNADHRSAAR